MTNNNDKLKSYQDDSKGQSQERIELTREDILSDDALHLPVEPQQVISSELGNVIPASGAVLKVDELLSSIDNLPALGGGFLTFDSDTSPGNTIVRVMLDDNGTQQAFDVGVFNGVGMDLNSLLGLISSQNGDPS